MSQYPHPIHMREMELIRKQAEKNTAKEDTIQDSQKTGESNSIEKDAPQENNCDIPAS